MVIQEYLNNPHVIQGIPHVSFCFCVGLKEVWIMEKRVSCKDVGSDCDFVACAKTEEEVFRTIGEHARTHHNMTEIPKELQDKVRSAIRDVERC